MKTKDFLKKHGACKAGAKWALSIGGDMTAVWDAMIEQGKRDWLIWTVTKPNVFTDSVLRKLACRFVRETPLHDGRTVWDLLTDERSRNAVEVAEAYADGKATYEELEATCAAAYAAAYADAAFAAVHAAAYAVRAAYDAEAAYAAAYATAYATAYAAARAAADAVCATYASANADAKAAQVKMIAELGNPFKERAKQ